MIPPIEHDGRRYEHGTREDLIEAGVPEDIIDAAELSEARGEASAAIDAAATAARGRYLTLIPGQELTYQRKAEQARAWLELPEAARDAEAQLAGGGFPLLLPEAAALGADPTALAGLIVARETAWAEIGGQIEAARVGGKADVGRRSKPHTIAASRDAAVEALNGL